MRRLNWYAITAAAVALAVGLACGGDGGGGGNGGTTGPTVPVPGTLVVSLTTPNSDDGAILFSISGGGISAPTAVASSDLLFFRATGTSSLNAVVVGNIAAGPVLRFGVPDVGQVSSYTASITEVADRNNALRTSLSGYVLSISRE